MGAAYQLPVASVAGVRWLQLGLVVQILLDSPWLCGIFRFHAYADAPGAFNGQLPEEKSPARNGSGGRARAGRSKTRRRFCGRSRTWRSGCKARRHGVPACRQGRGKRIKKMTVAFSGHGAPAAQCGRHCRRAVQGAFRHARQTDGIDAMSLAAGVECRSSHASGPSDSLRGDDIIRDGRGFWTRRHCNLRGRPRRIRLGRRIGWRRGTNHADWHHEG